MINFEKFTLNNGLKLIVNEDKSTPFTVLNLLYDVGSKDEEPDRTGFAHLFEHLMFGGSANIKNFDTELQQVGGENNAFTSTDITNYYITLPSQNIETAFWLESDRMLGLDFNQHTLDIQKNVVIEEFRQRYLNKPYGDVWLLLRPLIYKHHPYGWPTIGKKISHIEDADLDYVKKFFYEHYAPNNAVLSLSGNISPQQGLELTEKYFGSIATREIKERALPIEPKQTEERTMHVKRPVPFHSIYKAYNMCSRRHKDYYTFDLISDILANGKSSKLYQSLVKEKKYFSEVNAFISGEIENGTFIISGNLMKGVSFEQAESAINEEVQKIQEGFIFDYDLLKVKNKIESTMQFSETNILNRAMNLSKMELISDAGLVNRELEHYQAIEKHDIKRIANNYLIKENCSTLYYEAQE